jgi:hypothetical protein
MRALARRPEAPSLSAGHLTTNLGVRSSNLFWRATSLTELILQTFPRPARTKERTSRQRPVGADAGGRNSRALIPKAAEERRQRAHSAPYNGRLGRPESRLKPSFHCEREIASPPTTVSRNCPLISRSRRGSSLRLPGQDEDENFARWAVLLRHPARADR